MLAGYVKPGFHMIVPIAPVVSKYLETIPTTGAIGSLHMIVPIAPVVSKYLETILTTGAIGSLHMIVSIAPVVSKYLETILTTGAIGSLHMIVSIASEARVAGSSAMSLGQTVEFLRVFNFASKPHKWMIFIRKANLVPWYLLFLPILRH